MSILENAGSLLTIHREPRDELGPPIANLCQKTIGAGFARKQLVDFRS